MIPRLKKIKAFVLVVLLSCAGVMSQDDSMSTSDGKGEGVTEAKEWKANAGFSAILNTGNAENQTFGGNAALSRKWHMNETTATANGAYGRAKNSTTGNSETNTKNWKTALRYDRFISEPVSIFALGHIGQDVPAGFDWRFGGASGVSHSLLKSDVHFFKYEAGYDYTREYRVAAADANIHSARIFLQYKYMISKSAQFGQDVENLLNLQDGSDFRLNALTSLTMKLTDKIAFQMGFGVRFDNQPVAGFKSTDTTTQAGLVLNFL
ncbi:MAG: DUF481 domain-containing protein [Bdellovibrionales bacterium]|nr:DUF481 domain-containing protein [Bdellovibrionales bacterium]